ncbi:hypothetical protein ACQB60_35185 [Actinomycetota bacterium Odt1-20B]
MGKGKILNSALERLLAETGWTEEQLAREVNRAGQEAGLDLRYDRTSVSHWLRGRQPWQPAPHLLAEALSRRLERTVSVTDIGMAGNCSRSRHSMRLSDDPRQTTSSELDAVLMLKNLAEFDSQRRKILACASYSLAALAVPAWPPPSAFQRSFPERSPATQHLTAEQIAVAERMAAVFTDTDDSFGGGHSRTVLAAYLAHDIAPRLQAPGSRTLRRRMLVAAAQLTYLCGFMCFDDRQHGLAQHYYRTVLSLASEAGAPGIYAFGQRALSVQAHALGHFQHAMQLAELAASTAQRALPPHRHAFFLGQVAVASAALDNRAAALSALGTAERRLSQHTSSTSDFTMGRYHPASLEHQHAAVTSLLGDRATAITALTVSLRHRPADERRSRAITSARLAGLQVAQGHLEQAVATWHTFLDDYPHLSSARATAALKDLRSRLRPYAGTQPADVLLARAATLAAPCGRGEGDRAPR